jgi:2-polyprenyl-6-methoxyphenol hydroxylase-like FAD-dependent oxidoreductase
MKIAISGAGVAGPALAYWLHRTGHEPTLIERAPQFRTGGYVIDFWGVGYLVAERMGIGPTIRDAGYQVQAIQSIASDGRIQASLGVDAFRSATAGKFISIPRGDLAAAIYTTVENDVEAIFGDSITAIDEDPDGVYVTFEYGQPRRFDLVIGADGLHSNVRRLTFGPESNYEHYLGCVVAAGVVDDYPRRDELVYRAHTQPSRLVARFSLRDNRTLFMFVFRSEHPSELDGIGACRAALRREFADVGWECPLMLAALDGADDLYFDVVSQIRLDRWSRGRVLLIGDAAGCVSLLAGEGAGLAITEAYVVAGELLCANGDHRQAFPGYEARLRPLVEAKQASAEKFIPVFAARTQWGIRLRNLAMRAMNVPTLGNLVVGRSLRDNIELRDYFDVLSRNR